MNSDVRVVPVILSGGTGTGLWPMSRELFPKQLLPLLAEVSLLQQTAWRVQGHEFSAPLLMCGEEHRFAVAAADARPRHRAAGDRARTRRPGHRSPDRRGRPAGRRRRPGRRDAGAALRPRRRRPGRLRAGRAGRGGGGGRGTPRRVRRCPRPVPRPGSATSAPGWGWPATTPPSRSRTSSRSPSRAFARDLVAAGDWSWNSGMFVFPPRLFLEELERLRPRRPRGGHRRAAHRPGGPGLRAPRRAGVHPVPDGLGGPRGDGAHRSAPRS